MAALIKHRTLAERGWVRYVSDLANADAVVSEIGRIGDLLGTRSMGRAGGLE